MEYRVEKPKRNVIHRRKHELYTEEVNKIAKLVLIIIKYGFLQIQVLHHLSHL
jgi:hypothetical protein